MADQQILLDISPDGEFITDLESLEIDVKNMIFKINGVDFGKGCSSFSVVVEPGTATVRMEKRITFTSKA